MSTEDHEKLIELQAEMAACTDASHMMEVWHQIFVLQNPEPIATGIPLTVQS